MKEFTNKFDIIEYAENIGKYDYEIAKVEGKPAMLSSTILPFEEIFRYPIEEIVRDVLGEMGFEDKNKIDDISMFIGAEMEGVLIDMIEQEANVLIYTAGLDF